MMPDTILCMDVFLLSFLLGLFASAQTGTKKESDGYYKYAMHEIEQKRMRNSAQINQLKNNLEKILRSVLARKKARSKAKNTEDNV